MKQVLKDSLKSDYAILLQCPFLQRNRVVSVVREEYGSKAENRRDLQQIIEEQWTEVSLVLRCSHRSSRISRFCLTSLSSGTSVPHLRKQKFQRAAWILG